MGRTHLAVLCALTTLALSVGCSEDPRAAADEAILRGNAFFDAAKYSEATIEYRRAIQSNPQSGDARNRLAETYLKTNDLPGAFREMVRAADLLPDNLDVQIKAGNLLLAAGRFEDARGRADHVLQRDPKHPIAHVLRGNALAGLKDLDGALTEMEEAISAEPGRSLSYASLGMMQHLRGDKLKADEAFKRAVELEPKSMTARLSYANYLVAAQRLDEAEAQLQESFRLDIKNPTINRALAIFYAMSGRVADAEPYLKRLAEDPNDSSAQFSLAQLYLGTKRVDEAVALLTGLAARDVTFEPATLALARLAYARNDRANAHTLVQEVLNRSANNPRALVVKAAFLMADKKPDEALKAATAATAGDPGSAEGFFIAGEAHRTLRRIEDAKKAYSEVLRLRPNEVRTQVILSQLHLATGSLEVAKQLADQAVQAAPQALVTRAAVVRNAIAGGDFARADSELQTLVRDYPKAPDVYILQGTSRMVRKDFAGAERAYSTAATLYPTSLQAVGGLIGVDLAMGRSAAARKRVEMILASNPNVEGLLLAARTYAGLKELDQTEALLRRALQADATRTEPYGMLGQLYIAQRKLDQALTEFQTLAKHEPTSVAAHTMVGALYQYQNRRPEAKEWYRKTLTVDASAPVAANNLAWMMMEDGENLDDALQLAQSAQTRLPQSPDVADTVGWIYFKKGLTVQAITALKEAIQKQPETAGFNYHLGLAYAKNGDFTLARKALETALKLDPKAAEATEARAVLSKLAALGS